MLNESHRLQLLSQRIQCTKTIIPNGNIDDQMHEIKIYFKDFQGKKPENFCLGDI